MFSDRIYDLYARWEAAREAATPFDIDAQCTPEERQKLDLLIAELSPSRTDDQLPELPKGTTRYRFTRFLAKGGMGEVYAGEDTVLGRTVAIKVLRERFGSSTLRFREEAMLVAKLSHPCIVPVHDFGELGDGRPFFAMELVAGGSLADKLRTTALPAKEAATLLERVARAIHAAHQASVVHRDLKPGNVLLTADGAPKVSDFGLAKQLDADTVHSQTAVVGTPSYMSPEQAAGKSVGSATDVWALGAVLYECLTGRPPFKGATVLDTLDLVRDHDPLPLRQLQPGVPKDLETVCLKCLNKEPAKRYKYAADFGDDLSRFLAGEPVLARPLGPTGRLAKSVRRRPALAAAVAASVLGLIGILVVSLTYSAKLQGANQDLQGAVDRAETAARETSIERDRATDEATNAKAAAEFLAGLFEAPDPLQLNGYPGYIPRSRGEKLDNREMLRRGAIQLDQRTDLKPEVRATLLERIGNTLCGIGDFAEAAKVLKVAHDLRMQQSSPEEAGLAGILHSRAWVEHLRGNQIEAQGHYRAAIQTLEQTRIKSEQPGAHGVEATAAINRQLSVVKMKYALLLGEMELATESLRIAKEALETRQSLSRDDDQELGDTYLGYATVAFEARRYAEGLEATRKGLAIIGKRGGNDSLAKAISLFHEGMAEASFGKEPKEAAKKLRAGFDLVRSVLGEEHVYTLIALGYLGQMLADAKQFDQAERAFRDCFDIAKRQGLLTHPRGPVLFGDLCERPYNRNSQQAQEVAEAWLAAHEAANPKSVTYASALTQASKAFERSDPARHAALQIKAYEIYQMQPQPLQSRGSFANLMEMSRIDYVAKNYAGAEAKARKFLVQIKKQRPDFAISAELIALTATRLYLSASTQGKFPDDLEEHLVDAKKAMATSTSPMRNDLLFSLEQCCSRFYCERKRLPEATACAQSMAKLATNPGDHQRVANALSKCGWLAQGKEAELLVEEALAELNKAAAAYPDQNVLRAVMPSWLHAACQEKVRKDQADAFQMWVLAAADRVDADIDAKRWPIVERKAGKYLAQLKRLDARWVDRPSWLASTTIMLTFALLQQKKYPAELDAILHDTFVALGPVDPSNPIRQSLFEVTAVRAKFFRERREIKKAVQAVEVCRDAAATPAEHLQLAYELSECAALASAAEADRLCVEVLAELGRAAALLLDVRIVESCVPGRFGSVLNMSIQAKLPHFPQTILQTYLKPALVAMQISQWAESEKQSRMSLSRFKSLDRKWADRPILIAQAATLLAISLDKQNKYPDDILDILKDVKRELATTVPPKAAAFSLFLVERMIATHYRGRNDLPKATSAARSAARLATRPDLQGIAAIELAECGKRTTGKEATQLFDEALTLLEQAVSGGFRSVDRLDAFQPVSDRAEFKSILKRMQSKKP